MKLQTVRCGVVVASLSVGLLGVTASAQAAPGAEHVNVASVKSATTVGPFKRLINVHSVGTSCGKQVIASASGRGKMTLRIDDTRSVGTVLSKHIEASKGVISAGVGWDVTKSHSITVSGAKEVPSGKYGTLDAYTKYAVKKFDVQEYLDGHTFTIQKGKKAYKPIGVCFKYTQR
ncbi:MULTISPECIES: hypothetical protein [unclassified Streptomyces]|uniref:hypothetical protein n=1 Tax=unclassified Streptomyces TaxID=2593676 RepID=UPI00190C1432|nr:MULTISPECIES: hypothetical protein [unclassified Streptomyces]MBK3570493.1 hypothetical protein [Streptomyces sp. MBT62]MBK6014443.1 hypothetical protein [Streptomyces sp. MBT53]